MNQLTSKPAATLVLKITSCYIRSDPFFLLEIVSHE